MSRAKIDLEGKQFGKLKTLKPSAKTRFWDCVCECRVQKSVRADHLTRKKNPTVSCGCENRSHGQTAGGQRTPTYMTWAAMKQRCEDNRNPNYGGAGIQGLRGKDFANFYEDMGERPAGMTLDRVDPFKNYERHTGGRRWSSRQRTAAVGAGSLR